MFPGGPVPTAGRHPGRVKTVAEIGPVFFQPAALDKKRRERIAVPRCRQKIDMPIGAQPPGSETRGQQDRLERELDEKCCEPGHARSVDRPRGCDLVSSLVTREETLSLLRSLRYLLFKKKQEERRGIEQEQTERTEGGKKARVRGHEGGPAPRGASCLAYSGVMPSIFRIPPCALPCAFLPTASWPRSFWGRFS